MNIGDLITGTIQGYAFGGEGILKHNGFIIFVPFAIDKEEVRITLVEKKKSYGRGKIAEILEPSQERRTPFCPYFGKCGGCQLQHMSEKEQLTYKESVVASALRKSKESIEIKTHSAPPYRGWREKITLQLSDEKECNLYYRGEDPSETVSVSYCPIFIDEEKSTLFASLQKILSKIPDSTRREGRLTLIKGQKGLHGRLEIRKIPEDADSFWELLKSYFITFSFVAANHERSFGKLDEVKRVAGASIYFDPAVFQQNHFLLSEKLYKSCLSDVVERQPTKILDLYSGCGILSQLILGAGIEGVACEASGRATEIARKSTADFLPEKKALFIAGLIEEKIKILQKMGPFDGAIINPPRSGMSEKVIKWLLTESPKFLIYVSCMPSTLARDLVILNQKGYRVKKIDLYDLFPQTAHMETKVLLERN